MALWSTHIAINLGVLIWHGCKIASRYSTFVECRTAVVAFAHVDAWCVQETNSGLRFQGLKGFEQGYLENPLIWF